jgi:hypothetical protein
MKEARAVFRGMRRARVWTPEDTQGANILLHALHEEGTYKLFVR